MSDIEKELHDLIRPLPKARYEVDYAFHRIESMLSYFESDNCLNLTPDFQRGHVWTQAQQERWVEAVMRGAISSSGLLIQFNSPNFLGNGNAVGEDALPDETVCVDGLQRLTAIRRFVAGEIKAFGKFAEDFSGTSFDIKRLSFKVAVHDFGAKSALLRYYIDLNAGGTPHSEAEISRVTEMLNSLESAQDLHEFLPGPGAA